MYSFVLGPVACLSFADIATLRFTVSEGVVVTMAAFVAFFSLISLGSKSEPTGETKFARDTTVLYIIATASLVAVVYCGFIAHSISKGKHPYYNDRRRAQKRYGTLNEQDENESIIFGNEAV